MRDFSSTLQRYFTKPPAVDTWDKLGRKEFAIAQDRVSVLDGIEEVTVMLGLLKRRKRRKRHVRWRLLGDQNKILGGGSDNKARGGTLPERMY